MRRIVVLFILFLIPIYLTACSGGTAEQTVGTEIDQGQQRRTRDKAVFAYWFDWTFEKEEEMRRGESGLTRSDVFGDVELQEAAEHAQEGLDINTVAGVLEYAWRLIPAIENTEYFNTPPSGWWVDTIYYHTDGVCYFHYDEWEKPENYEEMTEQERHYSATKYDGGMYVIVSLVDGHIISLQNAHNGLIEGKTAMTTVEEGEVSYQNNAYLKIVFFNDVTLEQHFTGWEGTKAEMYANAPGEVSAYFADEELQELAAAACADLQLNTAEGMAEYAWRLGEILCNTEYEVCAEGFETSILTRYIDGAWEIYLNSPEDNSASDGENRRGCVYVSEEDGHIICMFDYEEQLVQINP